MKHQALIISIKRIDTLYKQWENQQALWQSYQNDAILCVHNPSNARYRERAATRVLLHQLLPEYKGIISYAPNGQPLLQNGYYISISHSSNCVAIALHPNCPVGIDIETIRPKIKHIAPRFLSEKEISHLQQFANHEAQLLHHYTVYWCAKEALYKWHGLGKLDFRKHLHINHYNTNNGNIEAQIDVNGTWIDMQLYCRKINNANIAVWTL